ncbi:N-acetylglucosamine-6-phosphate deacetylase-like [Homarus americanus]|uniref:N-acetylglucosamine-6-phosphate deacetylase-like n=1 Tax=Homarus americanus TaxID=6706 RepID=UPI001C4621CA|nr:N-acetylglucosamine-6-phosphate deacetylase-like [Homarus americanus]
MPSITSTTPPCGNLPTHTDTTIYQFINCRLVRRGRIVKDDFWVRGGKILNPEPVFYVEKLQADVKVDCHDALICPGFLDIQINGGYGYDFSSDIDKLEEGLAAVAKGVLATGVTSFLPTLVTSPKSVYHQVIPRIKKTPGGPGGASILGVHVEGPFISPAKKGAHPLQYLEGVEEGMSKVLDVYGSIDNIAKITIAPELPGAQEVIRHLSSRGIVVSVGHSSSNLEEGEAAANNGATFITHLFNAMLPFHHRDPGLVGLLTSRLISHPVHYGIISDGIHTHPAALRIAHRAHPQGIVLVTDAMAAMGLGDGVHQIGQMKVLVEGRKARLVDFDTLAGSVVTMDDCVRHFINGAGVSLVEAIDAATLHPARVMGIDHLKGTLEYGTDADFVLVLDKGPLKVLNTFIAGECVYSASDAPNLTFTQKSPSDI